MYQPYPTGSDPQQMPPRPPEPQSVANAVKLMYAGAVISGIEIVISLTTIGSLKSVIKKAYPHYTASQVHAAEISGIALVVIIGLMGIGLWVLMARFNAAGRNWARIVATVLFGLNTLELISAIVRPHAILGLLFEILLWLVGLGAILLLWRPESTAYFQATTT